jgi:hypothetical protein
MKVDELLAADAARTDDEYDDWCCSIAYTTAAGAPGSAGFTRPDRVDHPSTTVVHLGWRWVPSFDGIVRTILTFEGSNKMAGRMDFVAQPFKAGQEVWFGRSVFVH